MSLSKEVQDAVDDLVEAGRTLERYEDPRFKPLSEDNFRTYDAARRRIHCTQLKLDAELHRLAEVAESVDPLVIRLGEVTTRLEAADVEVERLRDAHKKLHRRCQEAEAALPDYRKLIALPPEGDGARFVNGSLGRILLSVTCDTLANERDALQDRLAAANALLRECRRLAAHFFATAEAGDLYERIEAHLQGAGDEAAD